MVTAALDTNVLASGIVGFRIAHSTPGEILRVWREGRFELVVSEYILAELQHTLEDPYFRRRLTQREIAAAITLLRGAATIVPISVEIQGIAAHPEDDLVLATAVSAHADYLVTGDLALQRLGSHMGTGIVSPRDFLDVLKAG